ncbi:nitric oxide-associated protein 1-like isoform X2 [Homarus americanus]|uniref:nitric oxide-associated protein 1-like isoform X2 n=1 Tax=Homarus americanus TaxID=6706 RepID=UPI001C44C8AC|nr:nitric oxide-associated protein 1-like isoform X2 [Homarus americanus]
MAYVLTKTCTTFNIQTLNIFNQWFMVAASRTPLSHKCRILCRVQEPSNLRYIHLKRTLNAATISQKDIKEGDIDQGTLPDIVQYITDKHIIYSSHIADRSVKLDYRSKQKIEMKFKANQDLKRKLESVPLIIEKMLSVNKQISDEIEMAAENIPTKNIAVSYPYSHVEKVDLKETIVESKTNMKESLSTDIGLTVREDIACRLQAYEDGVLKELTSAENNLPPDYIHSSVNDDTMHNLDPELPSLKKQYGTNDPAVPASNVPCGGCGAQLHCQDSALPGFVPKELFEGLDRGELRSVLCQRCYFLKYYKMALNVRVSPEVYPEMLKPIKDQKALVMVVVDLLDMPCSIWPKLMDIIGTRRPVVVVGNKVDLLPADGKNHLHRVKKSLVAAVEKTDLGRANIRHIALVSAHTGFGIESLITKIQHSWGTKGDVYIVGCTNSGKSTLFNALLGSDMCKTSATSLIRRATTSPWPGTTLNMLKFPVLRPSGHMLYLRVKRLKEEQRKTAEVDKLKPFYTKSVSLGTLSGHIGRTLESGKEPEEKVDPFSTNMKTLPKEQRKILGINTSDPKYSLGRWCYDTPGTVQPDQLINLLTHEELLKVLPHKLISPRTYCLQSGQSLFIGGLARLDLLYSPKSVSRE